MIKFDEILKYILKIILEFQILIDDFLNMELSIYNPELNEYQDTNILNQNLGNISNDELESMYNSENEPSEDGIDQYLFGYKIDKYEKEKMNQFESIYISSESENEDKSSDSDYEWKEIDIVIDNTGSEFETKFLEQKFQKLNKYKDNLIKLRIIDKNIICEFEGFINLTKNIKEYLIFSLNNGDDIPHNFIKGEEHKLGPAEGFLINIEKLDLKKMVSNGIEIKGEKFESLKKLKNSQEKIMQNIFICDTSLQLYIFNEGDEQWEEI